MYLLIFNPDDVPVIDTDSDLDDPEEAVEADAGQQISDFDSESCQENPEPVPTAHVSPVEPPSVSVSGGNQKVCAHGGCYAPTWTLDGAA